MLLHDKALFVLLIALCLDALIGDPDIVWRRFPHHPVVWFGWLIARLDAALNRDAWSFSKRRVAGVISLLLMLVLCGLVATFLHVALQMLPYGWLIEAFLASILLAQRSLYEHVSAVSKALHTEGLDAGRLAVACIVGRDPLSLDEAGVARAAIESTAENFSDGVVAPVFWFALFGLPGVVLYKLVNTADSMIGHKNARYLAYGWAAARLDDGLNLVPARLSGLLIAASALFTSGDAHAALRVMRRDASQHLSPNAGWPEAAMAGALGVALAGPRRYGEQRVDDPFMNPEGRREAHAGDIDKALRIMLAACALMAACLATIAFLLSR